MGWLRGQPTTRSWPGGFSSAARANVFAPSPRYLQQVHLLCLRKAVFGQARSLLQQARAPDLIPTFPARGLLTNNRSFFESQAQAKNVLNQFVKVHIVCGSSQARKGNDVDRRCELTRVKHPCSGSLAQHLPSCVLLTKTNPRTAVAACHIR